MRVELNKIVPGKGLAAKAFGLALALVPLYGATARAQVQGAPPAQPQRQSTAQPQRPGAAARRARQAERMRGGNLTERLNLSPEQRRQLREIRTQGEPEARELTRRVRLARRALDEAIYSDTVVDALVEQRSRELAAAQAALVRLRATTELKVRRVLTVEQLQTFRELRRQAARRQLMQRRLRGVRGQQPPPGETPPDVDDPPLK